MVRRRKVRGLVQICRPQLSFAAGACVVLGEFVALGAIPSSPNLLLGFLWGFFLSSPALILNDYFDAEVDKVNAPSRPIPSGLVKPFEVVILTIITTLVGLIVAFVIGMSATLLYIGFWVIGFLYNWKLKELGLLGNLMVSSSVAITFILGSIVVGNPWSKAAWILGLMVFCINLGEEIAADAMDIQGDKVRNVKSVAVLYGRQNALRLSVSLFVTAIIISILPYVWGLLGVTYLVAISATGMLIFFFAIKLLKSQTSKEGHVFIRRIYLCGLFGMLAIIISMFFAA